jgi:hypothetical protein
METNQKWNTRDFQQTEQGRLQERITQNEQVLMWATTAFLFFLLLTINILLFY